MLMLLEEKQHMTEIKPAQEAAEYIVHQCLQFALNDSGLTLNSLRKPIPPKITYCGWHLIQFENTNPDDGRIYIDRIPVTKGQFIKFLQFEWTPTVQYYREEQEQIRAAYSRSGLDEIAQHIKQTTRMNHPEIARLRTLWQEKKRELERIETMFSDDDDDWDESDYVDPEMAEAELLLQERDSEDYASIEYEDHA
jgi:phage terminase Nu1 subunit (DNA packaging protein)